MTRTDIMAFVNRDRSTPSKSKTTYWRRYKAEAGLGSGLRISNELRRSVRARRTDWPSAGSRDADLATHARVGAMLRRVKPLGSR